MAAHEIVDFIECGNIVNSVNYPAINLGKPEGKRLVVLHEVSLGGEKIIQTVSSCRNVIKSATAKKGNYGVTIIDFAKKEGEKTCLKEAIHSLSGILKFRVIE